MHFCCLVLKSSKAFSVSLNTWFDLLLKNADVKIKCCIQKQSSEVFYEKSCLRNFTKLTGKHRYQSLFYNKVAGSSCRLRPATLLKKETLAQVFSCEFCEIFKNTLLQNTSVRLLLCIRL